MMFAISMQSPAQMFWNHHASFAGNSASYVSVPSSPSIDLTGSFTLEAWVNPLSLSVSSKGIISKGSTLGTGLRYGMRILTSGKISLNTNGGQKLVSSSALTINKWTHIAGTYNSSTNTYSIFINGQLDTVATVTGTPPITNSDSLFIGISGSSTPFNGKLDEVRIWNRGLGSDEISSNYRTSLTATGGIYSGLMLSIPFQKENASGTVFSVKDYSGNDNDGNARNVTGVDESYKPLNTISQNESAEFDGDEDYLAAGNNSMLNPTNSICLDMWIYPRDVSTGTIISKNNQYELYLFNGYLIGKINGIMIDVGIVISPDQWTKITFQYSFGIVAFAINGKYRSQNNAVFQPINAGTDSLFIGGIPGSGTDFNGFIDEVHLFDFFYSDTDIFSLAYRSTEATAPQFPNDTRLSYNLDGSPFDNNDSGGPRLYFRNNARFSNPATVSAKPVSPVLRDISNTMINAYYLFETGNVRIPSSGTTGSSLMATDVNIHQTISDIDLFVMINHTNLSSLRVTLIAPNNDSMTVINGYSNATQDNNLITLFDDNADSSAVSGKYASLYTRVKPMNSFSAAFGGDNTFGQWRVRVHDDAAGDTGRFLMCGIRFNNMTQREFNLSITNYIQGFYDAVTDSHVQDTMKILVRESTAPFQIVGESKGFSSHFGTTKLSFDGLFNSRPYYLQLDHRNSIGIWSANPKIFVYYNSSSLFYLSSIAAYGNNLVQVDASPIVFALYGGDQNQDGVVSLNDIVNVYNSASSFTTGYIQSDMTGDNIANLNDIVLTYNNSSLFIHTITP